MTGRLYAALSYNEAAVKWYTKAAEQECPEAQYELGKCYETGDGVGEDKAKAAELYRKAAVQGYAEAQKNWATAIVMV
ncbi:MAG: tetratricopeptide repeat protein [Ruminococcus callidus]